MLKYYHIILKHHHIMEIIYIRQLRRSVKQDYLSVTGIEELRTVVGGPTSCKLISASRTMDMPLQREAMKDCFTSLMNQESDLVKSELKLLINRLQDLGNYDVRLLMHRCQ